MATRRRTKQTVPLLIEPHPEDYTGYPFITLIQFRQQHILTIIDNSDGKTIKAYVLDSCGPEKVSEELIIRVAQRWYDNNRDDYPLSIEFSKLGISGQTSKIYRKFDTEFVSRVIGPLPVFVMNINAKIKKRRRKALSQGVEVHTNVVSII